MGTSAIEPAALLVAELAKFGRTLSMRGNRTTFNIGRISGGTAINIVPGCCEVLWEFRPPDADSAATVRVEVERLLAAMPPGVDVKMTQIAGVPALAARNDSAAVVIARAFGAQWPPSEIPFGTEAGFFEQAGIPSLVCGPGAIAQAHQPNEWIAAGELKAVDRFLARLGAWATGAEARA